MGFSHCFQRQLIPTFPRKIQVLSLKSRVSSLLKHTFPEYWFFRNKVIHTGDSAVEDQTTVTLKKTTWRTSCFSSSGFSSESPYASWFVWSLAYILGTADWANSRQHKRLITILLAIRCDWFFFFFLKRVTYFKIYLFRVNAFWCLTFSANECSLVTQTTEQR